MGDPLGRRRERRVQGRTTVSGALPLLAVRSRGSAEDWLQPFKFGGSMSAAADTGH